MLKTWTLSMGLLTAVACAPAAALDFTIDDFSNATNTLEFTVFFGVPPNPMIGVDQGLPGVLGGSRALSVLSSFFLVQSGVLLPEGRFSFMSFGSGTSTLTYDGGGEGLNRLLACAEAIEIEYLSADEPAIEAAQVMMVMVDEDNVSSPVVTRNLEAESGILSFPIDEFPGPDLSRLAELTVLIDVQSPGSDSTDFRFDQIRAVGCEFDGPAPSMGPMALTVATGMLIGLGYLGFRRRF